MSYLEPSRFEVDGARSEGAEQTITLTAEEAAAARWLLTKLAVEMPEGMPAEVASGHDIMIVARAVYQARKRRAEHFGAALFSEPAWDMLLVLYLYGDRGDHMSVTKLADFSNSPLTTAIRWLDYLESQRLIQRSQCPTDKRKFFVSLSAKGRDMLSTYFQSLIDSGDAVPKALTSR